MSKDIVKNYGKSIRSKLLNIAKNEDVYYQTVLTRYFQERLVYRISQTGYRQNFYLKGGALMYGFPFLSSTTNLHSFSRNLENFRSRSWESRTFAGPDPSRQNVRIGSFCPHRRFYLVVNSFGKLKQLTIATDTLTTVRDTLKTLHIADYQASIKPCHFYYRCLS